MKSIILKIVMLTLFLSLFSCEVKECHGVKIGQSQQFKTMSYCSLISKALNKDIPSIEKLAKQQYYDSAGYDHGSTLVEIIDKIGEVHFINGISRLNFEERKELKTTLEVGVEYSDIEKYKGKFLVDVFPLIHEELKSE